MRRDLAGEVIREPICLDWVAFIEGQLPLQRMEAFRAHMLKCRDCRESVIDGLQIAAQLSDIPVRVDVSDLARRYFEALDGFAQCDTSYEDLCTAELALRRAVYSPPPQEPKWMVETIAALRGTPRPRGRIRRLLDWLSWR